jgi:3-oxoacyl-[acyl-carrier-protein] synthase I
MFDAMGALSSKYNDTPDKASRTYDANRDGFVISGGGGIVVLEELEHAKARGAKIYAEVVGYGATSDGYDMVAPSGEGGERAMRLALATLPKGRKIDYINSHGTSTMVGDVTEVEAIRRVFGRGSTPPIASTKSLTGHCLGGAGVWEAIYSLLMMNGDFIAASANVTTLDPALDPSEIVTTLREGVKLDSVMSNSFGFGGTNATLMMSKYLG